MWTPFQPRQRKSNVRQPSRRTRALRLEPLEPRLALASFMVTSTADDGSYVNPLLGTLRAAIIQANLTPEHDTINFSVSGTISPLNALPAITNPVTIDGAGHNIVLDGASTLPASSPFGTGPSGLVIDADDCTVRNLTVQNFFEHGILIFNGSRNIVGYNQVISNVAFRSRSDQGAVGIGILEWPGGAADFNTVSYNTITGNTWGLGVGGGASDNMISGNTISDSVWDGVWMFADADVSQATPTSGNVFSGNTIQRNANGIAIYGSVDRIAAGSSIVNLGVISNTIQSNTISNNRENGVLIDGFLADGNAVSGNTISNNDGSGVRLSGGADSNTIGGLAVGQPNTIRDNGGAGVIVQELGYDFFPGFPEYIGSGPVINNAVLGNSIHSNGGLGLDLNNDGVTANDSLDGDSGPNHLQNFPEISVARLGPSTYVEGTLQSLASTTFTLDFYATNATGARHLDSLTITTDASGFANFSALLNAATSPAEFITATATEMLGVGNFGSTSEYSAPLAVTQLSVAGTAGDDSISIFAHNSGAVEILLNGASQGIATQVSVDGLDGSDIYTVFFGDWTGNVHLSDTGPTGADVVEFNGTAAADQFNKQFTFVEWNLDATPSVRSRVDYAGIETKIVFGRDGNDTILDPGEDTYLYGGPGDDTIIIDATSASGVAADGGEGSDSYVVVFGNLAGPVTVADSGTTGVDSLEVQGTAGDDAIALIGDEVQRGAERVIVAAPVANLIVDAGGGADSITVGDFTAPIAGLELDGGAGANEVSIEGSLPPGVELEVLDAVHTVQIDVHRSTVNVASSGLIVVALFSTPTFDARQVDIGSVQFAGAGVDQSELLDVDDDGDLDLLLKFRVADTNLRAIYADLLTAADQAVDGQLDPDVARRQTANLLLTGVTLDDAVFQGFDAVDLFLSGSEFRKLLEELAAGGHI